MASVNFTCYRGSTKKKFNYNVVDSRAFFDTVVEKGRGTFYKNFPKSSFVLSNKQAVLYLPKSESYAAIDFVVVFQEESEYRFLFKQCTTTANGAAAHFQGKKDKFKKNAALFLNSFFGITDNNSTYEVEENADVGFKAVRRDFNSKENSMPNSTVSIYLIYISARDKPCPKECKQSNKRKETPYYILGGKDISDCYNIPLPQE